MADHIPNTFFVGFPKCGTTSLHAYLNQHPDIFLTTPKEPQYFAYAFGNPYGLSSQNPFAREENYLDLFKDVEREKVIGEASTCYSVMSNVPLAIREFNKDAKIVAIMREPIQRAWSMYLFWHQFNAECKRVSADDFRQRFLSDDLQSTAEKRGAKKIGWLRGAGYYWRNLKPFYQLFPNNKIYLLSFDRLVNDPQNTLENLCDFLNVDRIQFDTSFRENKTIIPKFRGIYNFVNLDINNPLRRATQNIIGKIFPTSKLRHLANKVLSMHDLDICLPSAMSSELSSIYRDDLIELRKNTGFDIQTWIDT